MITLASYIATADLTTIDMPLYGKAQAYDMDGWGFWHDGQEWVLFDYCGFIEGAHGLEIPAGRDIEEYAAELIGIRQLVERISRLAGTIHDWY